MKKILGGSIAFLAAAQVFGAAFTPGNLLVVQVGDDAATVAQTNAATQVYVKEYTQAGVFVQTVIIPSSGAAKLTNSGTATAEGALSYNNGKFAFAGYDADAGTATVATSAVATVNRVIGIVDLAGNVNLTTKLSDANDGGGIRGAVVDGNNVWSTGTNGSGLGLTGGIRYTTVGATTSLQLAAAPTSLRWAQIFGGQLYTSASTGGGANPDYRGISTIGTGMPTTIGQSLTLFEGLDPVNATAPSNYGYAFADGGNTMYVADDRTAPNGGGLIKWTFNGSTWSVAYRISAGLQQSSAGVGQGCRGLTVTTNGSGQNVIYVTSASTTAGGNGIFKLTDSGTGTDSFSSVVLAGTFQAFRGVQIVPSAATSGTVTLQDYPFGDPATQTVVVEIRQGGNTVDTQNATLDSAGHYSFTTSATGSADLRFKGSHWLAKLVINVTLGSSNVNVSLRNGDVDDDNTVSIFDYIALSDSFEKSEGDSGYDARADLDGDTTVSIFDYIILSDNFEASGDE